jgi:hypothetical protein
MLARLRRATHRALAKKGDRIGLWDHSELAPVDGQG